MLFQKLWFGYCRNARPICDIATYPRTRFPPSHVLIPASNGVHTPMLNEYHLIEIRQLSRDVNPNKFRHLLRTPSYKILAIKCNMAIAQLCRIFAATPNHAMFDDARRAPGEGSELRVFRACSVHPVYCFHSAPPAIHSSSSPHSPTLLPFASITALP